MFKKLKNSVENILKALIGVALCIYLVGAAYIIHVDYFSLYAQHEHVRQLYYKIAKATGQSELLSPILISSSPEVNAAAYTDKIVINQGMLDFVKNDDELAMVIGHETAHVILGHVQLSNGIFSPDYTRKLEADADKYGAIIMMQAGYDICKGRELWKTMLKAYGDILIQDHPDFAYRYEQLNVNCSE